MIELLQDEGCPRCGELPSGYRVNGPDEIVLECRHVVDAKAWIDEQNAQD